MEQHRKNKIILLLLLAIFIFSSCQQPNPPALPQDQNGTQNPPKQETAKKIDVYMPMAVGNSWEYEGTGNEYASYRQYILYNKDNRYQVMIDNGGTVMANIYEVREDSIANIYRQAEVYNSENVLDKSGDFNIVMLKLPIQQGATWVSEENTYTITGVNEKVEVPAGTFEGCIVVTEKYKDETAIMKNYYKEGIGLVKSEFITEDGSIIKSELKSYKITDMKK